MTITSNGYGGAGQSIDTVAASKIAGHVGAAPHVVWGLGASVVSAVNRTVKVDVGAAFGWFVYDEVTVAETLTLQSATSTTNPRWDAIVLHRDWTDTSSGSKGKTSLQVLKGSGNTAAPSFTGTLASQPGVVTDQVLYLVPVLNTGVGTPQLVAPFSGGAGLYFSAAGMPGVDPASIPYGALVTNYGTPSQLMIRRGPNAAPVLDDLLNPPWTVMSTASTVSALSSTQQPSVRLRAGVVEFSGAVTPSATGGSFAVGGGAGNNYELCHLPSWAVPGSIRRWGAGQGDTGFLFSAGQQGDWLQVHIYRAATTIVYLNGLSFRL